MRGEVLLTEAMLLPPSIREHQYSMPVCWGRVRSGGGGGGGGGDGGGLGGGGLGGDGGLGNDGLGDDGDERLPEAQTSLR